MKKLVFAILIIVISIGGYVFLSGMQGNELAYSDDYGYEEGYVIETEVDGPEDCISLEKYDAQRGVCYVECDTPEECDAMEAKIDTALDALDEEFKEFSKGVRPFEGDASELEEEAEVVYRIDKGEKFTVISGVENENHKKVKSWLATISPDKFSDTYLSRLIPYTKEGDDTMAYVTPSSDQQKWDMYVNMDAMKDGDKEMIFTLIHEFSHILTLNSSQVDASVSQEDCRYYIQEGCVNDNAYLNAFYFKFWDNKGYDIESQDPSYNYEMSPNSFVTEYAATNPGEDIAESFASFVFKKKSATQDNISQEKVMFFYNYPELINMRESMRNVLKPLVRSRVAI